LYRWIDCCYVETFEREDPYVAVVFETKKCISKLTLNSKIGKQKLKNSLHVQSIDQYK